MILSCRKKDTMWDVAILTPLVQGELSIVDLLPDSITQINSDESVTLVFRENLLSYNFAEENISIPDTIVETFVSLDSLQLSDRTISQSITLGEVAIALGFPVGTFIILSNGSETPIDPITGLSSGEQEIDATSFFEAATLEEGFLDIEVVNGFPIPLTDINLQIRNASDDAIIVDEFVAYIAPGETFLSTTDLAGLTVDGNLIAEIADFSSPGSSGMDVLIDTSDALVITMTAYYMSLFEATAIFPAQNLVNNQSNILYDMGGPEFTEMTIKSGEIIMYIVNTIQDSIHIEYNIPGAVDPFGNSISIIMVVPPAPPDGSVIIDETFPLEGYNVDLRGQSGVQYNTFYNEFIARIDSTGEVVTISKEDSIQVIYGLQNIVPQELKGYFGQTDISESDTIGNLGLFDKIAEGSINLEDGTVNLVIANGVGIEGDVVIKKLTAWNSRTGQKVDLSAPDYINVPVPVQRAYDNPFTIGYTNFALTPANSNILDLIEVFPDRLIYELDLEVNPDGNNYNYQDFLNAESRIDLFLDLEIPLEFVANSLTLVDEYDSGLNAIENKQDIKEGTFTLFIDNGFPFEAGIKLDFLNMIDEVLASVDLAAPPIVAGELNADCRVTVPAYSERSVYISPELMQEILDADKVRITAIFDTQSAAGCNEAVKVYSDYALHFQLSADFEYTINLGN